MNAQNEIQYPPQWWRIMLFEIKLFFMPKPHKYPLMRIERDVVSGQSANCKLRFQIGFTVFFIGRRRKDGRQGYQIGMFAPTHGHSDTKTGYKCNKFYIRGTGK
jgi:hypothetical protein